VLRSARARGNRIVFTNGVFDILHVGHARYLAAARALGDLLVVGLNSDSSTRRIKGPRRPIVPQAERAELLLSLRSVDHVVIFSDPTPAVMIAKVRPDVLVKGADWAPGAIVGGDQVRAAGGRVVRIRLARGRSTTNIIKRVLRRLGK
jgi:D-beta-D-heptose 7-phosphate kinase/D-beta-D-heptose 1-phosphate adenosyltransferase